jgi:DNA-binding PadR family transcriptional regulator
MDDSEEDEEQQRSGPWAHQGPQNPHGSHGPQLGNQWNSRWRMGFGQRGWIRPVVLNILEKNGPSRGIDIMNRIQEVSHGWWKPSPGSIYPLLSDLVDEGIIKKGSDDKYELTGKYKSHFGPMDNVEETIVNMEGSASYLEELKTSDKKKFAEYRERIKKVSARLARL